MYTVNYTKDALKTLRKLPRNVSAQIVNKIKQYAADPAGQANNVKQLTGHPGYRLRVADWRVLFTIDSGALTLLVIKVGPRGSVYEG